MSVTFQHWPLAKEIQGNCIGLYKISKNLEISEKFLKFLYDLPIYTQFPLRFQCLKNSTLSTGSFLILPRFLVIFHYIYQNIKSFCKDLIIAIFGRSTLLTLPKDANKITENLDLENSVERIQDCQSYTLVKDKYKNTESVNDQHVTIPCKTDSSFAVLHIKRFH